MAKANIEIKAHQRVSCNDLVGMMPPGCDFLTKMEQTDTYFKTQTGRLKLREIIDCQSGTKTAMLIPYIRPDQSGPKVSSYCMEKIEHPTEFKQLMMSILGQHIVVHKIRIVWLYLDTVRIHLDTVTDLGLFFELEGVYDPNDLASEKLARERVDYLMHCFQIKPADLITTSYEQLVQNKVSHSQIQSADQ